MKTKDYLMYLILFTMHLITFTLWSLIFLARKMPVFFAISVMCTLCTMLIIYLCIKNIEIRTRDMGPWHRILIRKTHFSGGLFGPVQHF